MIRNIKAKIEKLNSWIDYHIGASKITFQPAYGQATQFVEGSKLRDPSGEVWVVKNGVFN